MLFKKGVNVHCKIKKYLFEKIFEKMGQVSLEDLKSLPLLHLKRLTVAQLYDWLHCSGNTGNPDAIAFVEDLAKSRKEKYQY